MQRYFLSAAQEQAQVGMRRADEESQMAQLQLQQRTLLERSRAQSELDRVQAQAALFNLMTGAGRMTWNHP